MAKKVNGFGGLKEILLCSETLADLVACVVVVQLLADNDADFVAVFGLGEVNLIMRPSIVDPRCSEHVGEVV